MYTDNFPKKVKGLLFIILVMLFTAGIVYLAPEYSKAEAAVSVTEINYYNSTITFQVTGGDSKVYISDSGKKNWDQVPGSTDSSGKITLDISWISQTRNYELNYKGDSTTKAVSVTLPKQVTNFKATYNKSKGTISFSNTKGRTIEWRKSASSNWYTVNTSTISNELSYLCNEGAALYFRLAPINGTSKSSIGCRASKEVSVKIPVKAAAPTVKVDGSTLSISVVSGEAYRVVYSDNTTSDWTTVTRAQNLALSKIAASAMYSKASTQQSKVTLQFRTNSSSSKQTSKTATVTVPIQEGPPSIDTYGISLSYTSSSTVSLMVKAASTTVPFEYTIVDKNEDLDYLTAKWTSITSNTAVSINNKTAKEGNHIYVRKKSIEKTDDVDFALASVEVDISGTNGVTYPDEPSTSTLNTLITNAGKCKESDTTSYLTFTLYSAVETTVSSVNFLDSYGVDQGAVTIKSTVAKNKNSTGDNNAYIITTKITSTSNLDSKTEKLLYAKITLANSDIIKSTDSAGIRLYLYPYTKVNNPTADEKSNYSDYSKYSTNFSRVYESIKTDDDSYFKFKLDLGTANVPSATTAAAYTSDAVGIKSIKYQDYTLTAGTDYTTSYGSYVNDDEKTITTLTVTVNASSFERSTGITITDTSEPLKITLNNEETLNDSIYMTLVNTATINSKVAWSMTEKKLKATKTTTTTTNGTTTTTEEDVITYTLSLALFDKNYAVGITDVTWGGVSVLGSTTVSNGTATVNLSNTKLNSISVNATSTTNNLVITFSNGFSITTGATLTILDSGN